MKFKSFFHASLVLALSSICYGAQSIVFPTTGTAYTELTTGWTQSSPNTGDPVAPKAFYNTIGASTAVSVGAYYDDYAEVGGAFSIDHAISPTLALTDSALLWSFTISEPPLDSEFPERNDYSFSLLDGSSANLVTVNFTYTLADLTWKVSINGGNSFADVDAEFNYLLSLSFAPNGANADYAASIIDQGSTTGSIAGGASAFIGHANIGTTLGAGNTEFGEGFITVVPEPGTTMLALLPAFFILRRRR